MSGFPFCIPSTILWHREANQIEYGGELEMQKALQLLQKHTKDKIEVYHPDDADYWKFLPRAYQEDKISRCDL